MFLDGAFAFGLAEDLAARLVPGSYLSEVEVLDLQREDGLHQVLDAALLLLSYRPRSVAELRRRLLRKEFDPALVDQTLEKLERQRVIGDEEFARFWVENRQSHRPRGNRLLSAELRLKGVDRGTIDSVIPEPEEEEAAAYRAARAKLRSLRGLEWPEFRKRLGEYLVRRGFGYGVAAPTVRRVWDEVRGLAPDDVGEEDAEQAND